MKFRIRYNENARKEWKLISNILMNWIFVPLFLIQGLARLISGNDKEIFYDSFVYQIFLYVGGSALCLSILLNIIHWLKPKWFENKNEIG
jgi:hypothetical protein